MADLAVPSPGSARAGEARSSSTTAAGDVEVTVVVPFLNSLNHLKRTAPEVIRAAANTPGVELIYVDNGATDGSAEYLRSLEFDRLRVLRREGATISAMRNWGSRQGSGAFISFLDADCGVAPSYFDDALAAMRTSGADATGCEYALPESPRWIEQTLHDLHYQGRDRDVNYINAGNFFITRAAFDAVDGFREDLRTGEDADIGQRLVAAGKRLHESTAVNAVHYGNPQSLSQHYRRTVWHGLGMFATVTRHRIDKPSVMLGLHLVATVAGLGLLATAWPWYARVAAFLVLQAIAPALTVAYRIRQTGRVPSVPAAVVLYWVYYWARAHALALIVIGRGGGYRK